MGSDFDQRRFIPYVSMHEFEALLFSDCQRFAESIKHPDAGSAMQKVLDHFGNPEKIDDSPATAPSKRILALVPTYDKEYMGVRAIREIGLENILSKCQNFACWLSRLEGAVTL